MRLCVISLHCCPYSRIGGDGVGGMNVYVKEFSTALSCCPGTHIDIFTRAQTSRLVGVKTLTPSMRVIHLKSGPIRPVDRRVLYDDLPEFAENLRDFIRRERQRYDAVYSHYWLSGLMGEFLKHNLDIPLIHTYHTLAYLKKRVSVEHEHRNRELAERHLSRVSDVIISSSAEEKKSLVGEYGVPASKIEVIYPGVNQELFYPIKTERVYAESGFSPDDKILLYVGRVEPVKGLMTVIEALDVLNELKDPVGKRLRLVVVGGGERGLELSRNREVARIRAVVEEKKLTDKVVFLGSREQNVLKEYYSAAEALIVPSLYESFGLVVVEALACGTPVLVSQVGKMKTIVKEGKNGFSFPPRNPAALAGVIQEFFRCKGGLWTGERIRHDVIEKFSWERTGKQTYGTLMGLQKKYLCSTRKFQPDESLQLA